MTPLALSADVIAKLCAYRAARKRPVDDIERDHDAVMLFGGMGSPGYITTDGRILIDADEFWESPAGVREANSDDEVIAMLTVGAKTTGIEELLDLIPAAPPEAIRCPMCKGSRWYERLGTICLLCRGRSWATQAMIDARPDLASLR